MRRFFPEEYAKSWPIRTRFGRNEPLFIDAFSEYFVCEKSENFGLQVAGSIIGKGGQNITKLRSQVSRCFFRSRRYRIPRSCFLCRSFVFVGQARETEEV